MQPSHPPLSFLQHLDPLSPAQQAQFEQIGPLYRAWNAKLNLISRKDIEHLAIRHVLHSLSIARVVTFQPASRVLDVGTGGGFPGIPLAILFPQTQFYLIDSIGKKINAVQHIANALALHNVVTHQVRAEAVAEKFDFVLGRAVTKLDVFCSWVKDNLKQQSHHSIPNGILYLKGDDPVQTAMPHRVYALCDFFEDPFFATKQLVHLTPQQG